MRWKNIWNNSRWNLFRLKESLWKNSRRIPWRKFCWNLQRNFYIILEEISRSSLKGKRDDISAATLEGIFNGMLRESTWRIFIFRIHEHVPDGIPYLGFFLGICWSIIKVLRKALVEFLEKKRCENFRRDLEGRLSEGNSLRNY